MGMSESRPEKRKIEFVESYWTGGELGADYQWNDNHGELIRCKNCKHYNTRQCSKGFGWCERYDHGRADSWFCADGVKRDG